MEVAGHRCETGPACECETEWFRPIGGVKGTVNGGVKEYVNVVK